MKQAYQVIRVTLEVKGKDHSDSECAIAQKLATDAKFEESYIFKEDKSLFSGLFVSKSFTLETN